MGYPAVWGGRSMPIIGFAGSYYQFSNSDNIKVKYEWLPVKKRLIEVESGQVRHRIRGYRLRVTISFERPGNKDFVEYMRGLLDKRVGVFYPHPGCIGHSGNVAWDYWNIIPESDFNFDYFMDKFVGHKGELVFLGQDMDNGLPVSNVSAIYATV